MASTKSIALSANTYYYEETVDIADVNASGATITLPIHATINPHVFISYTFVNGSDAPTTPGAGTITIQIKEKVNPENKTDLLNGTAIDATAPEITLSANANINTIEIVDGGIDITVATQVIVRVMANLS